MPSSKAKKKSSKSRATKAKKRAPKKLTSKSKNKTPKNKRQKSKSKSSTRKSKKRIRKSKKPNTKTKKKKNLSKSKEQELVQKRSSNDPFSPLEKQSKLNNKTIPKTKWTKIESFASPVKNQVEDSKAFQERIMTLENENSKSDLLEKKLLMEKFMQDLTKAKLEVSTLLNEKTSHVLEIKANKRKYTDMVSEMQDSVDQNTSNLQKERKLREISEQKYEESLRSYAGQVSLLKEENDSALAKAIAQQTEKAETKFQISLSKVAILEKEVSSLKTKSKEKVEYLNNLLAGTKAEAVALKDHVNKLELQVSSSDLLKAELKVVKKKLEAQSSISKTHECELKEKMKEFDQQKLNVWQLSKQLSTISKKEIEQEKSANLFREKTKKAEDSLMTSNEELLKHKEIENKWREKVNYMQSQVDNLNKTHNSLIKQRDGQIIDLAKVEQELEKKIKFFAEQTIIMQQKLDAAVASELAQKSQLKILKEEASKENVIMDEMKEPSESVKSEKQLAEQACERAQNAETALTVEKKAKMGLEELVRSIKDRLEKQIKLSKEATTERENEKKVMEDKFAAAVSQSSGLKINLQEAKELLLKKRTEEEKLQVHLASLKNNHEKERKAVDTMGKRLHKAETMLKLTEKKIAEFGEDQKTKLDIAEVNKVLSTEKVKALEKKVETLAFETSLVKTKLNALSVAQKKVEELTNEIKDLNSSKVELEKKITEWDVVANSCKEHIAEKNITIETMKKRAAELGAIKRRIYDDMTIQKSELESKITAMEKHTKSQNQTYGSKLLEMNRSYEQKRKDNEAILQKLNVRVNTESTKRKLAEANVESLEKLLKMEKRAMFAARAEIYTLKTNRKTTAMTSREEKVAHRGEQTESSSSSTLNDGEPKGSPSRITNKSNQTEVPTSG